MPTRPLSILLIEDEAIIAASEAGTLRRKGFEVTIATSAAKALRTITGPGTVDCVLMDIDLSDGTDGTVLAEEILALRDVPIVFLSSHSEPDLVRRAGMISSYGYIMKATMDDQLVDVLNKALCQHQERKQARRPVRLQPTVGEWLAGSGDESSDFVYAYNKREGSAPTAGWIAGSMERLTGFPSAEVHSRGGWRSVVYPEDIPSFEKNVLDLAPGQSTVCELRVLTRDQKVRWVRAYTQCIADPEDPRARRIYGGCRDITAMKPARTSVEGVSRAGD